MVNEPGAARIAASLSRQVQDWVRCRLRERGETQHELAQRLHTSDAALSQLLRSRNLSLRSIERLVLGCGGTHESYTLLLRDPHFGRDSAWA